jgi:hypothetical protein
MAFVTSCLIALVAATGTSAQSVAVLEPVKNTLTNNLADRLESELSKEFEFVDRSQSAPVLNSFALAAPYNLTILEAANLGAAIGSNYLVLVKADAIRRNSFIKKGYFEAYAAIFVVESRNGGLIKWTLETRDAQTSEKAIQLLLDESVRSLARKVRQSILEEHRKTPEKKESELSPETKKNVRPPLPYRRLKPEYTTVADLYGIEATVDILVEINEQGEVIKTSLVRWAGFGLDESVESTVREMQWRAGDRSGNPFTMSVMLRYNFIDIDNPET